MPRAKLPLADRFWPKVQKTDGCWLWKSCVVRGYGVIQDGPKLLKAHRVAYELAKGPIPRGLIVLHKCYNPLCVNPDHLVAGDHKENARDREACGRTQRGEIHVKTRLTAADVRAIRAATNSQEVIAAAFGIGQSTVSRIKLRKVWRHI